MEGAFGGCLGGVLGDIFAGVFGRHVHGIWGVLLGGVKIGKNKKSKKKRKFMLYFVQSVFVLSLPAFFRSNFNIVVVLLVVKF